jgi:hypothetical protein
VFFSVFPWAHHGGPIWRLKNPNSLDGGSDGLIHSATIFLGWKARARSLFMAGRQRAPPVRHGDVCLHESVAPRVGRSVHAQTLDADVARGAVMASGGLAGPEHAVRAWCWTGARALSTPPTPFSRPLPVRVRVQIERSKASLPYDTNRAYYIQAPVFVEIYIV